MNKYYLKSKEIKMLADTQTPVSLYLKIRDRFSNTILLESSDYHGEEDSYSYICCSPIASFVLHNNQITKTYPDRSQEVIQVKKGNVVDELTYFAQSFESDSCDYPFINNGLFGYMAYDAVQQFEDIDFSSNRTKDYDIPDIYYNVYRYVIVIDHFKDELYLFENDELNGTPSSLDELLALINSHNVPIFNFKTDGKEESNFTDAEFVEMVKKGIKHCMRGDVFQIVLSRRFQTKFKGDEFNVYRALRSINPSPYLFYFDFGSFRIFGSSPEAQIIIKDKKASIYPIAGTFRRTGNDKADATLAKQLSNDEKENSEHVMLVDLARNDLSRDSRNVTVEIFKEVQYYSHVIHLVSKVTGTFSDRKRQIRLVADTFPAGTLSGAPKYMAMSLINKYENVRRGCYGGAIGYLGFNGDFNHAIVIRSFLSENNTLYLQAGGGIVAKSIPENELQEVNNKLAALRQAIKKGEYISNEKHR